MENKVESKKVIFERARMTLAVITSRAGLRLPVFIMQSNRSDCRTARHMHKKAMEPASQMTA